LQYGATVHAFSPQGNLLVTSGQNRNICFWDTVSMLPINQVNQPAMPEVCRSIAFSHDGRTLVCASVHTLYMLQPKPDNPREWNISFREIRDSGDIAVSFAPDDLKLAVAISSSQKNGLNIWTRIDKDFCNNWQISPVLVKEPVYAVAFSPNGKLLVTSTDNDIKIFSVNDESCQYILVKSIKTEQPITSINFSSHKGQQLCAFSNNKKKAYIFDAKTWAPLAVFKGVQGTTCSLMPDDYYLFGDRLYSLKIEDLNYLFSVLAYNQALKQSAVIENVKALERSKTFADLPDSAKKSFKLAIPRGLEKELKKREFNSKIRRFAHRHKFSAGFLAGALVGAEIACIFAFPLLIKRAWLRKTLGIISPFVALISVPISIPIIEEDLYGYDRFFRHSQAATNYVVGEIAGLLLVGLPLFCAINKGSID
jgi:hypothetical protein